MAFYPLFVIVIIGIVVDIFYIIENLTIKICKPCGVCGKKDCPRQHLENQNNLLLLFTELNYTSDAQEA